MLRTPATAPKRRRGWAFRLVATLLVVLPIQSLTSAGAGVISASSQLRATAPPGPVRLISTHWAGYVATPRAGGAVTDVQATWVQPRIRCDRPNSSVAFWIGLGGATRRATGLEQIGTSADCSDTLVPSYSAWSERIPAPARPVELPVRVAPGDTITAQIAAGDTTVTFTLHNVTTDEAFEVRRQPSCRPVLSEGSWKHHPSVFTALHNVANGEIRESHLHEHNSAYRGSHWDDQGLCLDSPADQTHHNKGATGSCASILSADGRSSPSAGKAPAVVGR
jgi:hypothetical protein